MLVDGYLRIAGLQNNRNINVNDLANIVMKYYFSHDIIDKNTILESDIVHKYDILTINQGCELTTNPWNEPTNKGGKLILECTQLILNSNSKINLNNKGYFGGRHPECQGYSYCGQSKKSIEPNYDGGGGKRGGGGYGTKGNYNIYTAKGGLTYGNKELTTVYLGSGGGAGDGNWYMNGTNGGGAIIIKCLINILMGNNSYIQANGGDNLHPKYVTGCGSGGSIYLSSPKITNNGYIQAIGGEI